MSALAEKIKRLAESSNFYNEVIEILFELEARQPNYTIHYFPTPGPFPAAGPVYPWPNTSPFTIPAPNPGNPNPSWGEPTWPNTTICHNANTNGPMPQSDATGYVDPSTSNPTGVVKYDRDVVKSLERKIEEDGDNRFSRPVGYGG